MDRPDWTAALRTEGEDTILLDLFVEPGSSKPGLGPYDPWRQRIHARVGAQPTSGKANRELAELLGGVLGVRAADVCVVRGATTRRKTCGSPAELWMRPGRPSTRPSVREANPKMAKPKVEDNLRRIEEVLNELRERGPEVAVLVEGDRDIVALTALEVPGPILKINVGASMLNFCEAIARDYSGFVILTDWDKKGQELATRLKRLLRSTGATVDAKLWRRLGRLLPYQIHEVESLDRHVERLRSEVRTRKL